jgi:tripartite ATP-independent transporter DctP family solute receptor
MNDLKGSTIMKKINRRNFLKVMGLAVGGAALAACGGAASSAAAGSTGAASGSAKAVTLKISLAPAETSPLYAALEEFCTELEQKSGGSLKGEIYANTSLAGGNQTTALEMCQQGTLEISVTSSIVEAAMIPDLNLISLPWIWKDYDTLDAALNYGSDAYQIYAGEFSDKDLVLLGFAENGFREVTNNTREITKPDDMKNLKIRVLGNAMLSDTFTALGANPTDMNFNELYTGLQQGAVDGQENPVSTIIVPNRFYEVQKYMTVWHYSYDAQIMQISAKVWNKLSDEQKQTVQDCANDFVAKDKELARAQYETDVKTITDSGCKITELTSDQIGVFKAAVQSVIDKYAATYNPDIYKAFTAANA